MLIADEDFDCSNDWDAHLHLYHNHPAWVCELDGCLYISSDAARQHVDFAHGINPDDCLLWGQFGEYEDWAVPY